jgi:hypothetical protein
MCYGCWEEQGKPEIDTPAVREAAAAVRRVYDLPGGGVGGYGHIVFDDWNIEDGNIDYCLKSAECDEYGRRDDGYTDEDFAAQIHALKLFSALTEDERASALALGRFWGTDAPAEGQ